MRVSRMRPEEQEAVIALWHETCRDTYTFLPLEQLRPLPERRWFFRERIAKECELWVASEGERPVGFLALRGSYVDRLYVRPRAQRRGAGAALLAKARERSPAGLELHTHQKSAAARAFYERHGFRAVHFGLSPPPEAEPDVEYHWRPRDETRSGGALGRPRRR